MIIVVSGQGIHRVDDWWLMIIDDDVVDDDDDWLEVWNIFLFSHILGMSSSQLTNIFQRGWKHQADDDDDDDDDDDEVSI